MSDEIFQAQQAKVNEAINLLRHEVDGRLLFSMLLVQASVQAEMLLRAKMTEPPEVTEMFAEACGSAIAPDDPIKSPRVVVIDGKDSGTKH